MRHAMQPCPRILDIFPLHQRQEEPQESFLKCILRQCIIAREPMRIGEKHAGMQLVSPNRLFACALGVHGCFSPQCVCWTAILVLRVDISPIKKRRAEPIRRLALQVNNGDVLLLAPWDLAIIEE